MKLEEPSHRNADYGAVLRTARQISGALNQRLTRHGAYLVQINGENPSVPEHAAYEWIGVKEFARRLNVECSSIYEYTRNRCSDPIPHKYFGKLILIPWGSPMLEAWWQRRPERRAPRARKSSKQRNGGEFKRKENE